MACLAATLPVRSGESMRVQVRVAHDPVEVCEHLQRRDICCESILDTRNIWKGFCPGIWYMQTDLTRLNIGRPQNRPLSEVPLARDDFGDDGFGVGFSVRNVT